MAIIAAPELVGGISDFLFRCARHSDRREYREWYDLFVEDGVYEAYTFENARTDGVALFVDRGREALKERAAFWLGMWQVGRSKVTHLVGNVIVDGLDGEAATVNSRFVTTRCSYDGVATLHASGEYQDVLVQVDGEWRFKSRRVLLDSETLPPNFTDPL